MTLKENVSMPDVVMQSPLAGIDRLLDGTRQRVLNVNGKSCTLSETPFIQMLNIRGNAADARFVQAVLDATTLILPVQGNTASVSAMRQLLWLGPDEWLLKLKDGQCDGVESALHAALQGQHSALVRVGDGNTTLIVDGLAAADLLSRGCPLDLHPRVFPAGSLAQTHIAKASATVLCLEAATRFELTVRRSFADYLFRWLCEAGAE
jgi:sarcosine oxidase subunit gamma